MWRFAPDVDPTTPEIYTSMSRMLATPWGTYRTAPTPVSLGSFTQTSNPLGSAMLVKTDGSIRWVTGTLTKLWDSDSTGGSWTDRSGAVYSASTTQRWQFAQFGDVTIAVQLGNNPQSSSSGAFADLAGTPPKAALVCVQSNVVMLANYNNGSAVTDGWYASDVASHTTWSGGESANGRLLATPGAITCIISYQGRIIAFKDTSVYEGQYVGGVVKWAWRLLHPGIGASSPNGAATDGRLLFFYGTQGAWVYDGAQFTRVDDGVEKYLQSNFTPSSCDILFNSKERGFFIYHTSPALGGKWACFQQTSGLWSVGEDSANALSFVGSLFVPVKVPTGTARRFSANVSVSTAVSHYELSGTSYTASRSSVTTGWIGTDRQMTNVSRVIPLYVPAGDYSYNNGNGSTYPGQLTVKTATTRAGTMTEMTGSPFNQDITKARYDFLKSDRWFEFTLYDGPSTLSSIEGGMELSGLDIVFTRAGTD